MKIGFVCDFVQEEPAIFMRTAKGILDAGHQLYAEMREMSGYAAPALQRKQAQGVGAMRSAVSGMGLTLHAPFDSRKDSNPVEGRSDLGKWVRFAHELGAEVVNFHGQWEHGVSVREWRDVYSKDKFRHLDRVAECLGDAVSAAENMGIRLSLESVSNAFDSSVLGGRYVDFSYVFPEDHRYLQKALGYKIGANPDVCHLCCTWYNLRNGILDGVYPEQMHYADYAKSKTLPDFLERCISGVAPIHEAHIADALSSKEPDDHALPLGKGMLGSEGLRSVVRALPGDAIRIIEVNEDWADREGMRRTGYFPNTRNSIEVFMAAATRKEKHLNSTQKS